MNRIFIVLLILFSTFTSIYAHNEYYWAGSTTKTTTDINQATLLEYYSQIPLFIDFWQNLPDGIDNDNGTCLANFQAAYKQWVTAGNNNLSFSEEPTAEMVHVYFSLEPNDFDNVTDPGCIHRSVNLTTNKISINSSTYICFNSCINRNFTWSNSISQKGFVNFTQVALHELGHLLGLQHCTLGQDEDWPIMHFEIVRTNYPVISLKKPDTDGIKSIMNYIIANFPPSAPTNLTDVAFKDYYMGWVVTLQWDSYTDNTATALRIYREGDLIADGWPTNSYWYDDYNVKLPAQYYISAKNSHGETRSNTIMVYEGPGNYPISTVPTFPVIGSKTSTNKGVIK